MALVNVENTDLAAYYGFATHKHSNCCCGATVNSSKCNKCRPSVQICCVQVAMNDGESPIILRRSDWTIGDDCDSRGATNLCGELTATIESDFGCSFTVTLVWTVSDDCKTIDATLTYNNGVSTVTVANFADMARTWFSAPVTATNLVSGGTVTIESCPVPTTDWPSSGELTEFILKGWLYRSGTYSGARSDRAYGHGDSLCGTAYACADETLLGYQRIDWHYNPAKDVIVITAMGGSSTEVPYDGGAWSDVNPILLGTNPYQWRLRKVTACGDTTEPPPPPPDCDPGCWPECVLCPDPLSMALVVTQDPACCLHGSYGLTYDSGTDTFYLASDVGGPDGTCGLIQEFEMTCEDSTHVNLSITYKDVNGSTYTTTATVSASCTSGEFETAAVDIDSGVFFPGLCEGGIGKGANIRVVSV